MSVQFSLTRRQIRFWLLWIAANALGFALGFQIRIDNFYLGSIASGLAIGLAQWLVLQRHARVSVWWVLIWMSGWALAWRAAILPFPLEGAQLYAPYIMGALGGLAGGLLQAALLRLLIKPQREITNGWIAGFAFALVVGIDLYLLLPQTLAALAGAAYGAASGLALAGTLAAAEPPTAPLP
jgi:hypothetical protein